MIFRRYNKLCLKGMIALLLATPVVVFASVGDLELRAPVLDSEVVITTSEEFGGAVTSLTFRGKEFIDHRDHGRELQSASSFDGYGECFNPTEAGSTHMDHENPAHVERTSVVKSARIAGNRLMTSVDMGFWLNPGQAYPHGCGNTRKDVKHAVNTTQRGGQILDKKLTVGLPGFPNVIEHQVTFHVPEAHKSAVFEASAGYMPSEFSGAEYYDPERREELEPGNRQGEQAYPVILFTPDKKYAMGVYSPELPQNGLGYGRFKWPDVSKWNCVFRVTNVHPGAYGYRCFIVIGTLTEVEKTITRLAKRRGKDDYQAGHEE